MLLCIINKSILYNRYHMQLKLNDYEIKDTIRIIREWTELTRKEFSKKLNKSERTIESWEYGATTMNLRTFLEIAKKYNIEIILHKKIK